MIIFWSKADLIAAITKTTAVIFIAVLIKYLA